MISTPFGYWTMAIEEVARTLYPDDPTQITDTKAIRRAIFAREESVIGYITDSDDEAVILWTLTDYRRVVRIRFAGDHVQHVSIPLSRIIFLGGEFDGATSRMTEVQGFDAVQFRFIIEADEPIAFTLPMNRPNSVAGSEEIAFAQKLLGALYGNGQ